MAHVLKQEVGLATPDAGEVAALNALYRAQGLDRTIALLGVSRHTLDRLRGGLGVRRSTLCQARLALATYSQVRP
jgi:hypothetical protein